MTRRQILKRLDLEEGNDKYNVFIREQKGSHDDTQPSYEVLVLATNPGKYYGAFFVYICNGTVAGAGGKGYHELTGGTPKIQTMHGKKNFGERRTLEKLLAKQ